jgi:hypothetical protein
VLYAGLQGSLMSSNSLVLIVGVADVKAEQQQLYCSCKQCSLVGHYAQLANVYSVLNTHTANTPILKNTSTLQSLDHHSHLLSTMMVRLFAQQRSRLFCCADQKPSQPPSC